ncbi:DctP family TRAP transporter solute-binding subunit [Pseudorhodoferax sp. Leaf265]|uniref:DctP family TRAP transporter solute-binding subunit n=1 Tax=Pseudorhodoferax sp. Leaf265 TaxID=1736315 RepID=UPI0006FBD055|nr:DctP family TRAP transporter solute-binding subunit [Pseudorhodoferax sp. Leaf265]KQP12383.1 C4-dicarboxylate ABC transporter substrate-binding protein [Pseudorhodoferax sp. Leaf265]
MKVAYAMRAVLCTAMLSAFASFPAQAEKIIRYAHFHPAKMEMSNHAAAVAFKEHVEKKTNGSLKVQIYPAGQLGTAQQIMEGLRLGSVQYATVHEGGISSIYKNFNIFGMPFVFDSHAHAYKVLDGEFGKALGDDFLKKTGIRLEGFADNGLRHFTNSKRPIKTPEDLKGLKIRVQPSPVFIEMINAFGASPTAIDWSETPTALAQGTADGQENAVMTILSASLYQSQKHVTLDGHVYGQFAYLVNDRFYKGLTPVEKAALDEGSQIAIKIHRDIARELDMSAKEVLSSKGMTVTELTPAEIDRFRAVAQPPVRKYLETSVSKEWTDKLIKAAEAARH